MQTKACNLTEDEIFALIVMHGDNLHEETETKIERINYLHKRLKAFKEPETVIEKTSGGWGNG